MFPKVLLGIVSFGENDCGRRGGKPGGPVLPVCVLEISLSIYRHPVALKVCHISVVAHIEVLNEPSLGGFVLFQAHFRCLHQCS